MKSKCLRMSATVHNKATTWARRPSCGHKCRFHFDMSDLVSDLRYLYVIVKLWQKLNGLNPVLNTTRHGGLAIRAAGQQVTLCDRRFRSSELLRKFLASKIKLLPKSWQCWNFLSACQCGFFKRVKRSQICTEWRTPTYPENSRMFQTFCRYEWCIKVIMCYTVDKAVTLTLTSLSASPGDSRGKQGLRVDVVLIALPPLPKTYTAPLKQMFSFLLHAVKIKCYVSFFRHSNNYMSFTCSFLPFILTFSTFSLLLLFDRYSFSSQFLLLSICLWFCVVTLSLLWFGCCCGVCRIGWVY